MGSMYSGSMRGITASHNKGGLYFRGRTVPTNPNTARQQAMRSIVGGLMQSWSMQLSEAQRQGWRDYAAAVPVLDSLGQSMNLSGVNWFVKCNVSSAQITSQGVTPATNINNIFDVPTIFNTGVAVQDVTVFEGVFTTPPGTVTLSGTLAGVADANGTALLYIGAPQTPGVRFYKGPYQLAATADIADTDFSFAFTARDLSDPTEWVSATVPVAAWDGLYVPLKLVIQYEDGRRSQDWRMLTQFTDATP